MASKKPDSSPKEIFEIICKYLISQSFIKSSATLTIKFYAIDLGQAFALDSEQILHTLVAMPDSPSRFHQMPAKLDEKHFLETARAAQNAWSHLQAASRNRKAASLKGFY